MRPFALTVPSPTSPLVDFHLRAFARFVDPSGQAGDTLAGALRAVFPVRSGDGCASLEFVEFVLLPPRFDEDACMRRGLTLAAPLKVTVRIVVYDPPMATGDRGAIRDIKEQECYFGELPWMTARGTFVVDGVERVLTPWLGPGAGLHHPTAEAGASTLHDALGNALTLTRHPTAEAIGVGVAPGPFSTPDGVLVPQARRRMLTLTHEGVFAPFDDAPSAGRAASWDLVAPDGRTLVSKGQRLTARRVATLRDAAFPGLPLSPREVRRHRASQTILAADGTTLVTAHQTLHAAPLRRLLAAGVTVLDAYVADVDVTAPEALVLPNVDAAVAWMHTHLVGFDLDAALAWLAAPARDLPVAPAPVVVRAAGAALAASSMRGLRHMAREARAQMDRGEVDTLMPCELLNPRALWRALRTLVTSSATSVPLARRNPLATLAHLRRVAVGVGVTWPGAREGFVSLPPAVAVGPSGEVDPPQEAQGAPWDGALSLAAPLVQPEALTDGDHGEVLRATGAVRCARHAGRALVVAERVVLVVPDDPEVEVEVFALAPFHATADATSRAERPAVADGARVRPGDVVVEGEAVVAGALALGRSVRVAFADALAEGEVRVSERVLREGWFTSRQALTRVAAVRDTVWGCEERCATPPDAQGDAARHLDASGVAALGAAVRPGDVLVGIRRPMPDGVWEGASLRAPEAGPATVRHVEMFERRGRERCPRHDALVDDERALWEAVASRARAALGPEAERALENVAARCRDRIDRTYRGNDLPPGVAELVQVTLERTRALGVGDRLADRHGLVVTVRGTVPDDAMLRLPDGGRADVLLSTATAMPEGTRAEAAAGGCYFVKLAGG